MSSDRPSHHRRARGRGRGSNSNTTSPNLEHSSSRRPTTSPLDTPSATHDADSPRNPEGDNIVPSITPSLGATDTHDSGQPPTAHHESVENLISKLTTPTPLSKTDNKPYFPVGFAPVTEPEELLDEDADNLVYDSDDDDIDPVTKTVVVDRPLARPKVPPPQLSPKLRTQTRQDGSRRPKDRRVSEQQSEVNSAELLWFNRIYEDTFDISDDGAIYTIVPITLSTGLTLRPGDCIPADAADMYVQYVQDNTRSASKCSAPTWHLFQRPLGLERSPPRPPPLPVGA